MAINQTKTIDQLFKEARKHDLVLTPDIALADAINKRLREPRIGRLATTPIQLAAKTAETNNPRQIFLEVTNRTDLTWREASHAIENTINCWQHTGTPESILTYPGFDNETTRKTLEVIQSIPTKLKLLMEHEINSDKYSSIAVIGMEQMNALDQSILPDNYTSINRYTSNHHSLPKLHIYDSTTALIQSVTEKITPENADDIAIITTPNSEYSTLLKTELEQQDLPFQGGPGFLDEQLHRAYIQLLQATTKTNDTKIQTVEPILTALNKDIDISEREKRLAGSDEPALKWLRELIENQANHTYGDILEVIEEQTSEDLDSLRHELTTLGIHDDALSDNGIQSLVFYLQTYDIPTNNNQNGLLLANPKRSNYVDRSFVFYIGLDDSWTHNASTKPWIDEETAYRQQIHQFQSMLQNGENQVYLVQDSRAGNTVTPCLYLEELLDEEFERFSDLDSQIHHRAFHSKTTGFKKQEIESNPWEINSVSNSSLKKYALSPREYFFDKLVSGPDKDYFLEGNLYHDFAEFMANNPGYITDEVVEEVIELMVEKTSSFHTEAQQRHKETEYRLGIQNIRKFLKENPPEPTDFISDVESWGGNTVASHFDMEIDSSFTELGFKDEELGIRGKIDLVHSMTELVDYKSGSKKRASQITRRSSINEPSDSPNFQALLYLTYLRKHNPGEELSFIFFHFLESINDLIQGEWSTEDCLTTVNYTPMTYQSHIETREVYRDLCHDAASKCNELFEDIEYQSYLDAVSRYDAPRTRDTRDLSKMAESDFGEALREMMKRETGETLDKGFKQALRQLIQYRKKSYFKDDIDEFERFVDEAIEEMNRCIQGEKRFPIKGRADEVNERWIDNLDLMIEDEGEGGDD